MYSYSFVFSLIKKWASEYRERTAFSEWHFVVFLKCIFVLIIHQIKSSHFISSFRLILGQDFVITLVKKSTIKIKHNSFYAQLFMHAKIDINRSGFSENLFIKFDYILFLKVKCLQHFLEAFITLILKSLKF